MDKWKRNETIREPKRRKKYQEEDDDLSCSREEMETSSEGDQELMSEDSYAEEGSEFECIPLFPDSPTTRSETLDQESETMNKKFQ